MKRKIIKDYQQEDGDTGSSRVQIALLSDRIEYLTKHLAQHKKDFSSKRGLMIAVGQRRRLLRYLEKNDFQQYQDVIKRLGLRK